MTVEMKPGVWKRRDGLVVTVRPFQDGGWIGSDGHHRWNNGLFRTGTECVLDLVEFLGELEPEPQPDAADELAALRDDRDRWQARAVRTLVGGSLPCASPFVPRGGEGCPLGF